MLGRLLAPGLYVSGQEGFCVTHVNRLGMRNREIGPKRPGDYRILMLGDSYTEGFQVGDAQTR